MAVPVYDIRLMRKEEIPQALDIWKETTLHEGTHCMDTWSEVDPEAFYVAVTKEGEVLGVCSAVLHHDDLAFVGLYCVKEQYRGKGIGVKLWKACYDHIGERNGAVNAVPGKTELYRDKGGFPIEETTFQCIECEADEDVDISLLQIDLEGVEVRPLSEEDLPMVLDFDLSIMSYKRDKSITLTIKEEDSTSFVAIQDGKCVGYGTIKLSIMGHRMIGPLYAESQAIAEILLRQLIESFQKGKGLVMMTVTANQEARDMMKKLKVMEKEVCVRCYKNSKLEVDIAKVYGQLNMNFSPF